MTHLADAATVAALARAQAPVSSLAESRLAVAQAHQTAAVEDPGWAVVLEFVSPRPGDGGLDGRVEVGRDWPQSTRVRRRQTAAMAEAAVVEIEAALAAHEWAREAVRYWREALAQRARARLWAAEAAAAGERLRHRQAEIAAGEVPAWEEERLRLEIAQANLESETATAEAAAAEARLRQALGLPDDTPLALPDWPEFPASPPVIQPDPAGPAATAVRLAEARLGVAQTAADLAVAEARPVPRVALFLEQETTAADGPGPRDRDQRLGVLWSLPLSSPGTTARKLAVPRAAAQLAAAEAAAARRQAAAQDRLARSRQERAWRLARERQSRLMPLIESLAARLDAARAHGELPPSELWLVHRDLLQLRLDLLAAEAAAWAAHDDAAWAALPPSLHDTDPFSR